MSSSQILRRHRLAALLGAALVATPLALAMGLRAEHAHADSTPVAAAVGIGPGGSFAPIVSADKPAVVTVTTTLNAQPESASSAPLPGSNSPFDQQFRQFFGDRGIPLPKTAPPKTNQQMEALGSGFVVSPDGTIVTNNHVIDGASSIKVTLDDGTELPATLIGRDAKTDLAVLKVKHDKPLPTIAWGDSDKLMLGDRVLAIGNPFGIGTTVTAGIVSARGRDLHSGPYDDFIQIDAPINHGNSGGPLVDVSGKVVGINTAIFSPNGGSVGVGFAIPSDQAEKVVAALIKNGSIRHGFLGVQIQPVTADVAEALGLKDAAGALVAGVSPDSPAAKAGLKTGDVITAIAAKDIKDPKGLSRDVADLLPGANETITVLRSGKSMEFPVVIGELGDDQKTASVNDNGSQDQPEEQKLGVPEIGIGLTDITPDVRQAMNLPTNEVGALVESVDPNKPASASGLQPGDIIASVNQAPVKNATQANQAIEKAGKSGRKSVLLLVHRGDTQSFVAVPFSNG